MQNLSKGLAFVSFLAFTTLNVLYSSSLKGQTLPNYPSNYSPTGVPTKPVGVLPLQGDQSLRSGQGRQEQLRQGQVNPQRSSSGSSICPPVVPPEECPANQPSLKNQRTLEERSNLPFTETKKQKSPSEFYSIKDVNFEEAKVVEGLYYYLTPEKTHLVRMSGTDINRIVCPVNVQDVVYSEEKGIKVHVSGRNVFVKFQMKKVEDSLEISKVPADLHVVCNDKVFSLIAFPERIPAVLVYLQDKSAELKSVLESTKKERSFETKISEIVKDVFSGKVPIGAILFHTDKKVDLFKELSIKERTIYVFEGDGLNARYFELTNLSSEKLHLNERMFLRKELSITPVAVALESLHLKPGETIGLLIIEKKLERGE